MHLTLILSALLAPLTTLAAPLAHDTSSLDITTRQSRPAKPNPCVRIVPDPSKEEYKTRFDQFADAFIYKKNITRAFEFIAQDYINHNPAAKNGFDSAWNILSPIWGSQNITPLRTLYQHPTGRVNYRSGSFGEIIDQFRWEGGCVVEHWDSGEKWPTDTTPDPPSNGTVKTVL